MFTRIQARHFRCLRSIDQELGRFTVLVGPNASGKTTFLDVIALLGDLMRNGGKVADTVLERSRDFQRLLWWGEGSSFQLAAEARLPEHVRKGMAEPYRHFTRVRYEIEIGLDTESNLLGLDHEVLWLLNGTEVSQPRQPELFPSPPEAPASIFLKSGKGRKLILKAAGRLSPPWNWAWFVVRMVPSIGSSRRCTDGSRPHDVGMVEAWAGG